MRCVMFDFGNVIVHFDTQRFYDFIAAHQHSDKARPEQFFSLSCLSDYELGIINEREFFEAVRAVYRLDVDIDKFFWEFIDVMSLDQKMIRLKQVLKQNGIKLVLVSNVNPYSYNYVSVRWPEVFTDFNYLALSFQMKMRKPDLRMYRAPASHLGVMPEECILVDDYEPNVSAFQRWGGVGLHYQVVDETFCPNGRLEIERRELVFKFASLGLISFSQAVDII